MLLFCAAQSSSSYLLPTGITAPVGNWFEGFTYTADCIFAGSFAISIPSEATGM